MPDFTEIVVRFWENLAARPSGPMEFRFLLQPTAAAILAVRDGLKDARAGRTPYLWVVLTDRRRRGAHLRQGWLATARIFALGVAMDAIYQWRVFDSFRPLEAVVVSVGLAFTPYVMVRGPVTRLARRWMRRSAGDGGP